MKKQGNKRPHGQLRQSQVVTTFGPGAMLDLPNYSVLVAGLEHWSGVNEEIVEPRLADKICILLGVATIKLYAPPPDPQDSTAPPNGIAAWQFPEWFIVQEAAFKDEQSILRSRMMVHRSALTGGKYIDQGKKRRAVVPIRFVLAPAVADTLGTLTGERSCMAKTWTADGSFGSMNAARAAICPRVWIRCECKAERNMSQAAILQNRALGHCKNGNRPWLGPYEKEKCGEPNRLLIRKYRQCLLSSAFECYPHFQIATSGSNKLSIQSGTHLKPSRKSEELRYEQARRPR